MKSLFRMLILGLVLVVVALISALTSMRLAIHGRQVTVPQLTGLSPEEATRSADSLGLSLKVDREFYSATVPTGKIVSQSPAAGAQVRRGWGVLVAASLGLVKVSPPSVVGETERAATINIGRRGLQVGGGSTLSLPGQIAGMVLAQNPAANSTHMTSPRVSLLMTGSATVPSYVMPSFVGAPLASATKALADARMRLGSVNAAPAAPGDTSPPAAIGPASIVVSQVPAMGQRVQEGQAVNFEVRP